jgi:putative flippase GtrA
VSESSIAEPAGLVARVRSRVLHPHHPSLQFVRYVLVGAVNTALSFGVYRGLLEIGTPYLVAAPVAFAVGSLNGYVFNRRWTFAASDTGRSRVAYVIVQAAGAGTTSLLVYLFTAAGTGHVWAYLAAIPPVTVGTFAANRWWTFAHRD